MVGATDFAIGERVPQRIERPANVDELARILRESGERGEAVVLFGGSSLQSLGFVPARYDVAVDLRALDRVVAYESRDLTIGIEAGATLAALERTLAAQGQFVPLDAPSPSLATIGGTLASGWLGPRRASFGRPRDFVIGSSAVLADGTIARAGGMVVKNVTGYDTSRLYLGSFGTLVALAQINFKTLPMPARRAAYGATLPAGSLHRALATVRRCAIEPTAALAVTGYAREVARDAGDDGSLFVLFEGSAMLVERGFGELATALAEIGVTLAAAAGDPMRALQEIVDASLAIQDERTIVFRISGEVADIGARRASLVELSAAADFNLETISDARTGDLIARYSPRSASDEATHALGEAIDALGLRTSILRAPASLRNSLRMWGPSPAGFTTMRELKSRFDPKGTLAPGRFIEHL